MNGIEERLSLCKQKNEKAFITYMTAGLPSMEGTREIILAQAEAGIDAVSYTHLDVYKRQGMSSIQ